MISLYLWTRYNLKTQFVKSTISTLSLVGNNLLFWRNRQTRCASTTYKTRSRSGVHINVHLCFTCEFLNCVCFDNTTFSIDRFQSYRIYLQADKKGGRDFFPTFIFAHYLIPEGQVKQKYHILFCGDVEGDWSRHNLPVQSSNIVEDLHRFWSFWVYSFLILCYWITLSKMYTGPEKGRAAWDAYYNYVKSVRVGIFKMNTIVNSKMANYNCNTLFRHHDCVI